MMNPILKIALLIAIMACGTGCTTGYWTDRGRDAVDVFGVSLLKGYAVGARCGPIKIALGGTDDVFGLRHGIDVATIDQSFDASWLILDFEDFKDFDYDTGFPRNDSLVYRRNKDYKHMGFMGLSFAEKTQGKYSSSWLAGLQPHYLTGCEARLAIGYGIRIGFNPGELIDLLLGFVGIDIYSDDLERRKQQNIEQNGPAPAGD